MMTEHPQRSLHDRLRPQRRPPLDSRRVVELDVVGYGEVGVEAGGPFEDLDVLMDYAGREEVDVEVVLEGMRRWW